MIHASSAYSAARAAPLAANNGYASAISADGRVVVGTADYGTSGRVAFMWTAEAIDAAADRVKAAGGTILMGPHGVRGGRWILQCRDPKDAYFALVARKR
jgi:probable HAF family extracellular repeat protein